MIKNSNSITFGSRVVIPSGKSVSNISFGTNIEDMKPYIDEAKQNGVLTIEHLKVLEDFKNDGQDGKLRYHQGKNGDLREDRIYVENCQLDKAENLYLAYKNKSFTGVCQEKFEQIQKELKAMKMYRGCGHGEPQYINFQVPGGHLSHFNALLVFLTQNKNVGKDTITGIERLKILMEEFEAALPDDENINQKYMDLFG